MNAPDDSPIKVTGKLLDVDVPGLLALFGWIDDSPQRENWSA